VLLNSQQLRELKLIPGTRFLEDPILTPGVPVTDFREPWRHWSFQWMLAPVPGRKLGGVRAKLIDTKGFVTFINQRDLEVTMGHGRAGSWCSWLGKEYPSPSSGDWYGMCCDDEDLRDDIFERECFVRQELSAHPFLPTGLEIRRRLHLDEKQDVEELDVLLWDMDPDTRHYPDPRLQTVGRRWTRIQREKLIWERL
jgi:hypothetical protein